MIKYAAFLFLLSNLAWASTTKNPEDKQKKSTQALSPFSDASVDAAGDPELQKAIEQQIEENTQNPKETTAGPNTQLFETKEDKQQKARQKLIEETSQIDKLIQGSLRKHFKSTKLTAKVPGFISQRKKNPLGKIVGPAKERGEYQIGDTVFIKWSGLIRPQTGELYATYSPAIILQNKNKFSDFMIAKNDFESKQHSANYSHAGYFYEVNAELLIENVNRELVRARIISATNAVTVRDRVMQTLPKLKSIRPLYSKLQLSAAIVSGAPSDRLSGNEGSFIYLSRGRRDGIKVGSVFHSLEKIPLVDSDFEVFKRNNLGEAIVVYATEAYSTALILKQFDYIAIGSLMKMAIEPQSGRFRDDVRTEMETGLSEAERAMSELDRIEKGSSILGLTEAERKRLEKLHRQEKVKRQDPQSRALPAPEIEEDVPSLPPAPRLQPGAKEAKKRRYRRKKKEPKESDEQKLNQLF